MSNPAAESPTPTIVCPHRRQGGCLPWFTFLVMLALGGSVLTNLALVGRDLEQGKAKKQPADLRERWIEGEGADRVAVIDLNGVIAEQPGGGGPFSDRVQMVTAVRGRLRAAREDETVKALVLRIDSPGGAVTASDQIWREVKRFREETGRPVVTSMGGICASGGYYVAAATDYLVAEPTTITGSIGVILQGVNVAALLDKLGVKGVTIKSGAHKDLLNPLEPERAGDREIIQAVIDQAFDRFVKIVTEGRKTAGLGEAQVRTLADGRIFSADEALGEKLIDQIGYLDDAIQKARELAGLEQATAFRYQKDPGLLELLRGEVHAPALRLDLSPRGILELQSPRLLYLFR